MAFALTGVLTVTSGKLYGVKQPFLAVILALKPDILFHLLKKLDQSQKSQRRSWNRKQTYRRDTERFDKPWLVYLWPQYRQPKNRGILATSANGMLSILD